MGLKICGLLAVALLPLVGQDPSPENTQTPRSGWRSVEDETRGKYVVQPGTRIPLSLINSVSTKHSAEGDRVYLETVFRFSSTDAW
jgi:hypothetical protein